jgi:hypothetical protein
MVKDMDTEADLVEAGDSEVRDSVEDTEEDSEGRDSGEDIEEDSEERDSEEDTEEDSVNKWDLNVIVSVEVLDADFAGPGLLFKLNFL